MIGLILLLMLSLPVNLHAQSNDIKFEHISIEHGLSQSSIRCIFQDRKGFMWFGTADGLNKYDGYSFTIYKPESDNPNSLSHNVINEIYEDRSGSFWIGTDGGGLNKFNREKETFTHYQYDPDNSYSLRNNYVTSIYEDRSGVLWIGTHGGGLNKLDLSKAEGSNQGKEIFFNYQHHPHSPNSLSSNNVSSIYEDPDEPGVLWIGTADRGLNKLTLSASVLSGSKANGSNREKEMFVHYRYDPNNPKSLSYNDVGPIYKDRTGALWIGTHGGGLNKFDRKEEKFTRYQHDSNTPNSLSDNVVWSIYEDRSGMIWIGTRGGGLNKFEREKEKFTNYQHDPNNPHSLSNDAVSPIHEDSSGVLWIGTDGGGLNKLDRGGKKFTHYQHVSTNLNSLSQNTVMSIYEDRSGVLWIGTFGGGLNKFNRDKNTFTHYLHDPKNHNSLNDNVVWSIYEDRSGVLWIGTFGGGLNKFNRDKDSFTHYLHDPQNPNSLSDNVVWSICEDRAGVLWIGTGKGGLTGGLDKFDRKKETFTRYRHDPHNPKSLSDNIVRSIYEDRSGVLWIGTWRGGLNKFDRTKESFTHYQHDPNLPTSLSNNAVLSIYEDRSEVLWIGTWSGGLNQFDQAQEKFMHYREKDGLPNETVYGMLEDDHGNLWLSTNNGLSKFNPATKEFKNYDIHDGLQSSEYNQNAYFKSASGEMFFGGVNGFNAFHPDSIKDNPYIPPVVITAFARYNTDDVAGNPIVEKGISGKEKIELSYKDNILSFEFAALSYRNTFENQYAYKLEGFNENWIQLGTKRDVTFTNLDPGEYTLHVKGSNNDGVWNEEGTAVRLIITPPWWKTWWAYTLYVILIGAALFSIRRFEKNRIHLRNELKLKNFEAQKLQEVDQMKSRFFANISHEFRTPLTLILGPIERWLSKTDDVEMRQDLQMMHRNSRRLLRLIQQLLDLSKLEAGRMSLQARPQDLVSLLKGLVLSFISLAERKHITLTFESSEDSIMVYLDQDKLEKIVSNLLSNAFKFTPEGGAVAVTLIADSRMRMAESFMNQDSAIPKEWVEIRIQDTGVGIPPHHLEKVFDRFYQVDDAHTREHEGTGIGLALTKELVELHHGEIRVNSELQKGTTFVVRLPLGMEHLKPEEIDATGKEQGAIDQGAITPLIQPPIDPSIQDQGSSFQEPASNVEHPFLLIVEDNADVRYYMRSYLDRDYQIIEAENGVEGLEKAAEHMPDLIISDVMMPGMDGFEFCRKIRAEEKTSHIPVILLTARASGESKIVGLETGADDYVTKPFDAKELQVRVKNLIEQRRRLRERFSREVTLQPRDLTLTSMDEKFLQRAMAIVEEYMADSDFTVELFSQRIGMSRVHLNRKLKALTDHPANDFVRTLRLKRAAQLLQAKSATVLEIAYEVGFNNPSYFAECFRKQFGKSPSQYAAG